MTDSPYLTLDEAARILRCQRRTVENHVRAKDLRATKVGRQWLVHPDDLDRFVNAGENVRRLAST